MSLTSLVRWILLLFYLTLALPLGLFAAWFLFRAQATQFIIVEVTSK